MEWYKCVGDTRVSYEESVWTSVWRKATDLEIDMNYWNQNATEDGSLLKGSLRYGRLYQWSAALAAMSGWEDFGEERGNGTDDYSLTVLPAGYVDDDGWADGVGRHAMFWTSTEDDENRAYAFFCSFYYIWAIGV